MQMDLKDTEEKFEGDNFGGDLPNPQKLYTTNTLCYTIYVAT